MREARDLLATALHDTDEPTDVRRAPDRIERTPDVHDYPVGPLRAPELVDTLATLLTILTP